MSRRSKPPNRHGCKPDGDVCVEHDLPLDCNHGCYLANEHKCKFKEQPGWTSALPADSRAQLDQSVLGRVSREGGSSSNDHGNYCNMHGVYLVGNAIHFAGLWHEASNNEARITALADARGHEVLRLESERSAAMDQRAAAESRLDEQSKLLDQHREWTDAAQNAALRAQKARDESDRQVEFWKGRASEEQADARSVSARHFDAQNRITEMQSRLEDALKLKDDWSNPGDLLRINELERRLNQIAQTAGGDWGINPEFTMDRIYSIATGTPMRTVCPDCRNGERKRSGLIVLPCDTCGGTGRVVERHEPK